MDIRGHRDGSRSGPALRGLALTGLAAAGLLLSGCGAEPADVESAVQDFEQAVKADPGGACELLAPETEKELASDGECASALEEADVPDGGNVVKTDVAGHSARVVLENDTVFLALFDDGWKVTAAGCTEPSGPDAPYDCTVKGG